MKSQFIMLCGAAATVAMASPVMAQDLHQFDLPSQPLATSLLTTGRIGHVDIAFAPALVRGREAPTVRGRYSVEQAISSLLNGSGLTLRQVNGQSFLVVRDGPQRADIQAPMRVALATEQTAGTPDIASTQSHADPEESVGLEEIIVTAQKREESLQDTPISIAVLGSEDLEKRGVAALSDFASGIVPSLRVIPMGGNRPSTMNVSIRGINTSDSSQVSRDSTVGIYVDGVYLGRSQGLASELLDLDRMEILRGPQGTLFGRNAVGGAVSMVSKRPTGKWGLDLKAGVRNYDGRNITARINLPEFAGFSIKLDGVINRRDGVVDNPLAGAKDWSAVNRRGARVSVLWQPADNVDLLYAYDISRDASTSGYGQIKALVEPIAPLPPMFSVDVGRVRNGRAGVPLEPSLGKVSGHSLHATWNVADNLTLRSISAYRKLSQTQFDNTSIVFTQYAPNGFFSRLSYAAVKQDQFSQEFQFLGNLDHLEFVVGAFYFEEDANDLAHSAFTAQYNSDGTGYSVLPVNLSGPRFPDRASNISARSKAVFGQATYTPPILDERLHLTGGLRWTHDRKHGSLTRSRGAVINIPSRFSSKRVDPAFIMAFDWTDAINTYVKWGRAYRSGGANSRSATYRPFNEEQLSTWEIGAKTELFDRRVRFNLAAFHTDYSDRQIEFGNPANPSNIETLNAPGSSTIKGLELDLTARLVPSLTLTGSYSYTDWQALSDTNPFTGAIQRGVVNYTPKHATSVALDHEFSPFEGATLSTHVDAVYSGSFYTFGVTAPKTGSYAMLNGRVTLGDIELGQGGPLFSLSLWGSNLTNTLWETTQFLLAGPGLANIQQAHLNEPRTYGLEARIKF